jgi:outer membrane protein assembly factor BamB
MRAAVCFILIIMLAAPISASDWNFFKKDAVRSGYTADAVTPPLTLKWTSKLGYNTDSSPVVVDGVLYIGSNYGVHAIDAATGKEIWKIHTNGFVKAVPAVVDGTLYIGPDDRRFYAIDTKNGNIKWTYMQSLDGFLSSPIVVNDIIYVGSKDSNLRAIDARTGKLVWSAPLLSSVDSSPAVSDGIVYVGTKNGAVYALDAATGEKKWRFDTGSEVLSSPAVSEGTVFVGSNNGNIYALSADKGTLKWKFSTGNNVEPSPSIKDDTLFAGSKDSNFYAIDTETGRLKWKFRTSGFVDSSAAVSKDVVYIGSRNYWLYALDANTGNLLWKNSTGQKDKDDITSPAISGSMLYAATHSGTVYAYSSAVQPKPTVIPATTSPPTPTDTQKAPGFEYTALVLLTAVLIWKRRRSS